MTITEDRGSQGSGKPSEELQQVSIDQLVELVTGCGLVIVENPTLLNELKKRGLVMSEDGKGGKFVLHKAQLEPEQNDLKRTQSLVVDAYAPYSPKASLRPHPFAEDLARHGIPLKPSAHMAWKELNSDKNLSNARVSAPQQIIMQSPSEPEFLRTADDLITLESVEQEIYADVRLRAAYTRLVGSPRLELHLMLEEVQFGVTRSFNNANTRGHFVYSIEIKVSPSEKWAHHCTQTSALPAETYNLQRHSTLGVTERLSALSLASQTDEVDPTPVLNSAPAANDSHGVVKHRWLPAAFDPKSAKKAVEWTWKMSTWADGQPFREENPTSSDANLPELPFANPEVVRFRDLEDINEATWEVSTDVVKALHGRLDWSFEIKVFTACLQQKTLLVGTDVVTYRKRADRVASKFKGKTSRSNALIIPPPS